MRLAGLILGMWIWTAPLAAAYHVFQIPSLPGEGWVTTLTIYNEGDRSAFVRLRQWNESGLQAPEKTASIPVHKNHTWRHLEQIADGAASVLTEDDQVRVKLTFQHRSDRSLHELFITPDETGTMWLLPNAHGGTFSSLIIATVNPGRQTSVLTMTAFKRGSEVKAQTFNLKPGYSRRVPITQLWGLDGSELEAVLVSSDRPLPAPLLIAQNPDQSEHSLIAGNRIEDPEGERRFFVPHIPGSPWAAEITIYNFGAGPATCSFHQFDDSGAEIRTVSGKLQPRDQMVLATGRDGRLQGEGTAMITGRGSLAVKLAYRYGESGPWNELFLNGDVCRRWLLAASEVAWCDWYGIAVQNIAPASTPAYIRAYKDGVELANARIAIGPRQKFTGTTSELLHLRPWEFDAIAIEAAQPVPIPICSMGSEAPVDHLILGGQPLSDPLALKKWAFLFYNDSAYSNAYNPTRDFALEAYSGANLDVLILEDTLSSYANLYHVNPNRSLALIDPPGQKNMGDHRTLYDFLMRAKLEYPAERYILAFYDHGRGWQGCCTDETSGDMLSMEEIRKALSQAGGVDITMFTGPCLMAELESVYELRDWTDVYVGSEDLSGYIWFGTIQWIRSTVEENPGISSLELGASAVHTITRNLPHMQTLFEPGFADGYTMSAIDSGAVGRLADSLDTLCQALLADPAQLRSRIDAVSTSVRNYDSFFSVDLYDFLERFEAFESRPEIKKLIRETQDSLQECVLAEAHGIRNSGSHGLSIYFPLPPAMEFQSIYADLDYGLDFAADTVWARFVQTYKDWRGKN